MNLLKVKYWKYGYKYEINGFDLDEWKVYK